MRQIQIQVPGEDEQTVLRLAEEHGAFAPVAGSVRRPDRPDGSLILLNLPNDGVGRFVDAVERGVAEAEFVLFPRGAIPFRKPVSDIRREVRDVAPRSSLELVLGSLQSVGSWRGMLLYACFSGIVAAYGVIFSRGYLLTAAMLIAPLGAPAMVSVIGVTIGDWRMLVRGFARFWVAMLALAAAALLLGLAYPLTTSTEMMEEISNLSLWSVLLAVVGGAAGAQSQVQSERDSLVTATATGFLVAVALSPPSAVLGLAVALGRWDYVGQMTFIVILTYFGILLGGWGSLFLHGIGPGRETARRGAGRIRSWLLAAAAVLVVGLVGWQSTRGPSFRKADRSGEAIEQARAAVAEVRGVSLVEADAHFTRRDIRSGAAGEALLVDVVVERAGPASSVDSVEAAVRRAVEAALRSTSPGVVPYVDVTTLSPPDGG